MCGIEGGCSAPTGLAKKIGGDSLTQGVALGFAGTPPWGFDSSHRLGLRTVIKKSERKGRRSFDTAIEYGTLADGGCGEDADRKIGGPRYRLIHRMYRDVGDRSTLRMAA